MGGHSGQLGERICILTQPQCQSIPKNEEIHIFVRNSQSAIELDVHAVCGAFLHGLFDPLKCNESGHKTMSSEAMQADAASPTNNVSRMDEWGERLQKMKLKLPGIGRQEEEQEKDYD